MKRFVLGTLFLTFIFAPSLKAQKEQSTVAWINDQPISSEEFLYAFKKNRANNTPVTEDSLFNYLEQYLNFKLKVLEAEKIGLDTTQKFLSEFNTYTREIQKPYLQNPKQENDLIVEAYERLQWEIRAAHILVRIPKSNLPKDTLEAYNQIQSIRNQILQGADFGEMAKKNSQDGSASVGGDLGYFTGFSMVYPFESAAFQTEKGKVSEIVRSQFGYHLVKVLDRRRARGRVKTSHIFINASNKSDTRAKQLIQKAYDSLQNGGDWRAICATYSEDSRSRLSGGTLPFYGVGQFPEPLLDAAFELKEPSQYSKPIKSNFGWHILKLEEKEPIKSLSELKPDIINKIRRSGRNRLDKEGLIRKLKTENGFRLNKQQLDAIITNFTRAGINDVNSPDNTLFQIGDVHRTVNDFILFVKARANPKGIYSEQEAWQLYQEFENDQIVSYEESLIPQKYPDHQHLLNEYRSGLLLFEIMEEEVWNKALSDSLGLQNFFDKNRKKYWRNEVANVYEITSEDENILNEISSTDNISTSIESLRLELEKLLGKQRYELLKIAKNRYEQDDLPIFAQNSWKSTTLITDTHNLKIYWIEEIIPAGYQELSEIKGLVISDYQDFLEEEWVEKLRKNSKIKVNKKGIKALTNSID